MTLTGAWLILTLGRVELISGATVSFQYPQDASVSQDNASLAALMLPDGSHLHSEDTSCFILNSVPPLATRQVVNQILTITTTIFILRNKMWEPINATKNQQIELDSSILTVSQKLKWNLNNENCHFAKSSLLYFPGTTPPLAIRFQSIDDRIFFLHFLSQTSTIRRVNTTFPRDLETMSHDFQVSPQPLYVLNLVGTRIVPGARRDGRSKSIAIAFCSPWVHIFKPLLVLALDQFFKTPVLEVLIGLYRAIRQLDLAFLPSLTFNEKKVMRGIIRNHVSHFDGKFMKMTTEMETYNREDLRLDLVDYNLEIEMPVNYLGVKMALKIPTTSYENEIGDFSVISLITAMANIQISNTPGPIKYRNGLPYLWHHHLDCSQSHPFLILLFALISEKKVLFVGHGLSCQQVGNCVLACIAMLSGGDLISSIHRCFPYTCLANVDDLIKCDGFVAGVTNPMFVEQNTWWDVCIDLPSNRMTFSPAMLKTALDGGISLTERDQFEDEDLIHDLYSGIRKHVDETSIRQIVYDYVERFVTNYKSGLSGSQFANRGEGWSLTQSFKLLQSRAHPRHSLFIDRHIHRELDELQNPQSDADTDHIIEIFANLDIVVQTASDHQIIEILSYLRHADGACIPFSFGLFHTRREIQQSAARIITRLVVQKLGSEHCNPFVKSAMLSILTNGGDGNLLDIQKETTADEAPILDLEKMYAKQSLDPFVVSPTDSFLDMYYNE